MNVTIINDCRDPNAQGRQEARVASLFGAAPAFVGVSHELEAAGNLVDVLDAAEGAQVVLVNVAPRHGAARKWENGTPFGYFRYRDSLVVSTVDGAVLSLVKKLGLADGVRVLDTAASVEALVVAGRVGADVAERIVRSQFRSLDFLPRVAAWLAEEERYAGEATAIDAVADAGAVVWYVDSFGNCKTTLLPEEAGHAEGATVATAAGPLVCYRRLRDVPDGAAGLIVGSSGIGDRRFLEIVVQGESAAERFGLRVGSPALAS